MVGASFDSETQKINPQPTSHC